MDIKWEEPLRPRGRGIYALLGTPEEPNVSPVKPQIEQAPKQETAGASLRESVHLLPIARIIPNPEQPRKRFLDDDLVNLSHSIVRDGVLQPIVVTPDKTLPERWILVAGERRWRACRMAGLTQIPALIRQVDSHESNLRLALIENIQRAQLSVIEEAHAYERLVNLYGLTQQECADQVGKDRSTVANTIRLLSLPAYVQNEIDGGKLSAGHGRALLTLIKHPKLKDVVEEVVRRSLNVRQTEKLCKALLVAAGKSKTGKITSNADLAYLMENLRSYLQTKIHLRGTAQKGKIEISYFSSSELERLIELIGAKL